MARVTMTDINHSLKQNCLSLFYKTLIVSIVLFAYQSSLPNKRADLYFANTCRSCTFVLSTTEVKPLIMQATRTESSIRAALVNFSLLECLSGSEWQVIEHASQPMSYEAGEYLYHCGERAHEVFFLTTGCVKISNGLREHRELTRQLVFPLAMFGEQALFDQQAERSDTALVSHGTVHCIVVQASALRQIMRQNFNLTSRLLQMAQRRMQAAESRFEAMMAKDARTRIVDFIRDTALQNGRKMGFETLVNHSLTQQDIACLTGTSRQTVTLVLNELKSANKIHFSRKTILIRDLAQLSL